MSFFFSYLLELESQGNAAIYGNVAKIPATDLLCSYLTCFMSKVFTPMKWKYLAQRGIQLHFLSRLSYEFFVLRNTFLLSLNALHLFWNKSLVINFDLLISIVTKKKGKKNRARANFFSTCQQPNFGHLHGDEYVIIRSAQLQRWLSVAEASKFCCWIKIGNCQFWLE